MNKHDRQFFCKFWFAFIFLPKNFQNDKPLGKNRIEIELNEINALHNINGRTRIQDVKSFLLGKTVTYLS